MSTVGVRGLAWGTMSYGEMERLLTSFNVVMTQLVINKEFWGDKGGSSLLTSALLLCGVWCPLAGLGSCRSLLLHR